LPNIADKSTAKDDTLPDADERFKRTLENMLAAPHAPHKPPQKVEAEPKKRGAKDTETR
jgi:hypothetical protein